MKSGSINGNNNKLHGISSSSFLGIVDLPKYDSTESSAVADAVDLNVSSAVAVQERRIAWDGKAYTNEDFQQWYGAAGGNLGGLATVKADTLLLSALHMTVLGSSRR